MTNGQIDLGYCSLKELIDVYYVSYLELQGKATKNTFAEVVLKDLKKELDALNKIKQLLSKRKGGLLEEFCARKIESKFIPQYLKGLRVSTKIPFKCLLISLQRRLNLLEKELCNKEQNQGYFYESFTKELDKLDDVRERYDEEKDESFTETLYFESKIDDALEKVTEKTQLKKEKFEAEKKKLENYEKLRQKELY